MRRNADSPLEDLSATEGSGAAARSRSAAAGAARKGAAATRRATAKTAASKSATKSDSAASDTAATTASKRSTPARKTTSSAAATDAEGAPSTPRSRSRKTESKGADSASRRTSQGSGGGRGTAAKPTAETASTAAAEGLTQGVSATTLAPVLSGSDNIPSADATAVPPAEISAAAYSPTVQEVLEQAAPAGSARPTRSVPTMPGPRRRPPPARPEPRRQQRAGPRRPVVIGKVRTQAGWRRPSAPEPRGYGSSARFQPLEHVRDDGQVVVAEGSVHLRIAQGHQDQADEAEEHPDGTSTRPVTCGRLVTFIPTTPAAVPTRPRIRASPDVRVNSAASTAPRPQTNASTAAAEVEGVRTSATGAG